MSIFYNRNDVFVYKGDDLKFRVTIKNLLPNEQYNMFLEINTSPKTKKDINVTTDEKGNAPCVFSFTNKESKDLQLGKFEYGLKGYNSKEEENTYFPTPFVKGYWHILKEVVEGK